MISLQLASKKEAFDFFPGFEDIWPSKWSEQAMVATTDWTLDEADGEIFYILNDGKKIGITGWWPLSESMAGLRWHGVIPECRGHGFGKQALIYLTNRLASNYKKLIEVTMSDAPIKFFRSFGFEEITDPILIEFTKKLVGDYGHRFLEFRLEEKRISYKDYDYPWDCVSVFKLTTEHWGPSYRLDQYWRGLGPGQNLFVEVSYFKLGTENNDHKVLVRGGDAGGMERTFPGRAAAKEFFDKIVELPRVNGAELKALGFTYI